MSSLLVGLIGAVGAGAAFPFFSMEFMDLIGIMMNLHEGDDLTDNKSFHETRRKIGMVFQQFNLFDHMSVIDNIIFAPVKLKIISVKE